MDEIRDENVTAIPKFNEEKECIEMESKDGIIFYGDSSQVNSLLDYDYNDYLKLSNSKQNLVGFDSKYRDFVDYIVKITHNIWEEKGIGIIFDTYHNNITMHTGSTSISGIDKIIAGTLQTLFSFPDRKLISQNVIWSSYEKDALLSSHRILSTATNLNDSEFGKATNKKVTFRTTVDVVAINNRIFEEWLVRDNLAIVKQLGYDIVEVAKVKARAKQKKKNIISTFGVSEQVDGQLFPQRYIAADDSVGEKIYEIFNNIYSCRLFNLVSEYYDENAVFNYIGNESLSGISEIQGMLVSLFSSFPNAQFSIERITCNKVNESDYDVSLRWRLAGIHEGIGYYGAPSNKPVRFLGINQMRVSNNKIQEEWMTYDALDVFSQIVDFEEDNIIE